MKGVRLVEGTKSSFIDSGDVRIHVSDFGGDNGDTIVFMHPTGFLGAIWKPIVSRLRSLGYTGRVLALDQRGHGLSSKPDQGYEWGNFVDDFDPVLRRFGVNDAIAVGSSAGATISAGLSVAEPSFFRSLVLVDPILFSPNDRPGTSPERLQAESERKTSNVDRSERAVDNPMSARTRTRRLVWPSREELFESFRGRSPYAVWTDEALHAYVDYGTFDRPDGEVELLCPGRIEAQVYAEASAFDAFELISRLEVPALVIRGQTSESFDRARAAKAMTCLREGRFVEALGCGHFVPMEKPDFVAELVIAETSRRQAA